MLFNLTTDKPMSVPITVTVALVAGSATALDYDATPFPLTYTITSLNEQVTVKIFNDTVYTGDRSFKVKLSSPAGGPKVSIVDDEATGTINEDEWFWE